PDTVQVFFISATLEISRKVNLAQLLGFQAYQFYHLPAKNYHQQRSWVDKDFPDLVDLPLLQSHPAKIFFVTVLLAMARGMT
ncbi:hypothetical protein, partial [Streptococcus gordonii]|uniref:hypothetical protein n=1 Tax=Streptococcus gordonii TaxID=1302 RepID=UPI0023B0B735